MSTNNNANDIDNAGSLPKTKDKTPTLGEAIKKAVDTGQEVVVEGSTESTENSGIKDSVTNSPGQEEAIKENSTGIALSLDDESDDKLEITVEDETVKGTESEDKIVIDAADEEFESKEATVATVTTIPAEEEVEVEIQTEIEVPVKDGEKDVETDLKVVVKSPNATKEVQIADDADSKAKE
ncbi:MAG: hypothetical protein M3162_00460 [Thermoproteota archaeon]|nr:hypothetical protein [Thermoproteota archaeon]